MYVCIKADIFNLQGCNQRWMSLPPYRLCICLHWLHLPTSQLRVLSIYPWDATVAYLNFKQPHSLSRYIPKVPNIFITWAAFSLIYLLLNSPNQEHQFERKKDVNKINKIGIGTTEYLPRYPIQFNVGPIILLTHLG